MNLKKIQNFEQDFTFTNAKVFGYSLVLALEIFFKRIFELKKIRDPLQSSINFLVLKYLFYLARFNMAFLFFSVLCDVNLSAKIFLIY
jgi:hypothetical protein